MHAVDGLADQAPLEQVLEDEASRAKVEESLEERRASKHGLQERRKTKQKKTGKGQSASNYSVILESNLHLGLIFYD